MAHFVLRNFESVKVHLLNSSLNSRKRRCLSKMTHQLLLGSQLCCTDSRWNSLDLLGDTVLRSCLTRVFDIEMLINSVRIFLLFFFLVILFFLFFIIFLFLLFLSSCFKLSFQGIHLIIYLLFAHLESRKLHLLALCL